MISVEVTNISDLEKFVKGFGEETRKIAIEAAEDMVLEADRLAKEHARDKSRRPFLRTGRYLNSIHAEINKRDSQVTGKIASNVEYAGVLEHGSKPHVIIPRTRKALKFMVGGKAVFAKKVKHPGTPAFKVLTGAAEDVVKRSQDFVNKAMKRHLKNV